MKSLLFIISLLPLVGSVQAAESFCQQKTATIKHEITLAKKHNNARRVNGLERALTEARANCTDDKRRKAHQESIEIK